MRCRLLSHWNLLAVGLLTLSSFARADLADAYWQARDQFDWATAAERAQRWLEADPSQQHLLGAIAEARLQLGDSDACETWLARWEATVDTPTAPMRALRGELAWARDEREEARVHWLESYALAKDLDVARRLLSPQLWAPEERAQYETMMKRVADDYRFVAAMDVAGEAAVRERDWQTVEGLINRLNQGGTRSGMKTAASFEALLREREALRALDDAIATGGNAQARARRADFFFNHERYQLAWEDTTLALTQAPRAVLPKLTLARLHARNHRHEEIRALRVVTQNDHAILDTHERLTLEEADGALSQKLISPDAFLHRALLLAQAKQPFLALDDLKAAGPALEKSAAGYHCQALCFLAHQQKQSAFEAFHQALEVDPNHEGAWAGLAKLAMERADYTEAIDRYQWLVQHHPKHARYQQELAKASARLRPEES